MGLALPPRVEREILKEKWVGQRARQRALVRDLFDFDDPVCKEWNGPLRQVDPLLRMGRAKPNAWHEEFGESIRPGFYHIVRFNETAAPSFHVVDDGDGKFRYPDSGELENLKRNDLQDPRVWREQVAARADAERAREQEKKDGRVRRVSEALDRFKAETSPGVSMSDTGWTNSKAGTRGRKK